MGTVSYGMSGLSRSETRDIRGALSTWSMGAMFSQSLSYGGTDASDSPADWCGRVTAKSTVMGDYSGRYDYGYSPLGFLTGAAFSSSSDPRMDFSASWFHDRHGNITRMVRKGMLVSLGFGCGTSADISIGRDGNRISAVSVADIGENPLESQPAPLDASGGFSYDGNGNLTSDPSRGILDIEWSETGMPLRVSFASGEEIRYRFAATGGKLSEEFADADGTTLRRRDIFGSLEFTDGVFDRRQVDGGYIDRNSAFHVYVNDYQGNVIGVVNAVTGETVQSSDYYPYGLPHPTAKHPEANRRRFGGKEYTSEFGFSVCDFEARLHDTLLASFLSPDPKAADYPHLSPYAYCASDPVNFIDPTGEVIIFVNGLDKFGAKPAGEEYWTQSYKRYNFVNGAKKFFNDNNVLFIPVKHSMSSSAHERWQKGYDYAKHNIIWLGDLKKDETIKFVTHSMGAAYAEGMATFLIKNDYPVTSIVHTNAFQAADIESIGLNNKNVNIIDYQNIEDWIINKIPYSSSPGFIKGANFIFRESNGYHGVDRILHSHTYPIDFGKTFWKNLKNLINEKNEK